MKNKTLQVEFTISQHLLKDLVPCKRSPSKSISEFVMNMLMERIEEELCDKGRRISKVRDPIKMIINVKTAKL